MAPLSAYTEPVEPLSVPSTTWSWPLPRTSASAGLLFVFPLSVADQAKLQWLSTAISLLLSDVWYVAPVPKTMPTVDELPKNSPTAGEDCDRLVGVVLAIEPTIRLGRPALPAGLRILQVAAIGVVLAVRHAGGRVAPLDDLRRPVAVEVGQGRRGEIAIGLEPREAGEERSAGCSEGVLVLTQRACGHVGSALEVADGQRRLHAVVRAWDP